jgi:hypothetical protein
MNGPMNGEANSETSLRFFFDIKQKGWNTLSDKLDRPAYLQLFSEGHR